MKAISRLANFVFLLIICKQCVLGQLPCCNQDSRTDCLLQGLSWDPTQCLCRGGPYSPIVIDVSGKGFPLTSAEEGVLFDINADGKPEQVAWTARNSDVVFLVLDRDHNGTIDNGTELFGGLTPQHSSLTPNGFAALAEFDKPENGGNNDGVLDEKDAIFNSLRLWRDSNHDGKSSPDELFMLPELGVYSISIDYHWSLKRDKYGNEFRFRAKVNQHVQTSVGPWAYDVYLLSQ